MVPVAELVDRIRGLCKAQKTSLTKLEEQFGWANGTIGKWGKRSNKYPPHDKLLLIANALGVSVAYLTSESEEKEKPTPEGEQLPEITLKLIERIKRMDIDQQAATLLMLNSLDKQEG